MSRANTLGTAFPGILTACAPIVTALLVRREFFPPPALGPFTATKIKNWGAFKGGQPFGPAGRPVSLIVFSDYQCPACRVLSTRLDSLRGKFPTLLSVDYRNVAIPGHRFARAAA
jgi:protein-disulfide isomerase